MPKIGDVVWSEKDTKVVLVEKAEQAGVPYNSSMTKAELIDMMHAASDVEGEEELNTLPPPITEPSVVTSAVVTPAATGVLAYLKKAGKRVAYEQIIEDCGPDAKAEIKRLIADGKVTQYKVGNKFYFAVI